MFAWNVPIVAALAIGAMAAVKLRAVKAARIIFFIGSLHLMSGDMSGFSTLRRGSGAANENAASQHLSYALNGERLKPLCVAVPLLSPEHRGNRQKR